MYELKFNDKGMSTYKFFETFEDACAAMVSDWEDHANGFAGDGDFLADLEAERDNKEWRCYREEGDNEAYAVLAHIDDEDNKPAYEWWVREAKKHLVEFSIRISTCRTILASSEDDAETVAENMLYDRDNGDYYWESICQSMDNDYENFRKKYCEIEVVDEAPEEYEADNWEE